MITSFDEIRKAVAGGRLDKALQLLSGEGTLSSQQATHLGLISGQYNTVRRKENMFLIKSDEATFQLANISRSILDLVNELESPIVKPAGPTRKVFISYNHADAPSANKLKEMLSINNVEVIIDHELIKGGDDISSFIKKSISETDVTISIVSKKSLLSSWVSMESILTFYHEIFSGKKKFLACYLEDDFFRNDFTNEALDHIDTELKKIETLKAERVTRRRNTRDLDQQYTRLKELANVFDENIRRLRESVCINIADDNLEKNFPAILKAIM